MRGSSRRVLVVAATMELLLLVQAVFAHDVSGGQPTPRAGVRKQREPRGERSPRPEIGGSPKVISGICASGTY